jgi:hypothetical protein
MSENTSSKKVTGYVATIGVLAVALLGSLGWGVSNMNAAQNNATKQDNSSMSLQSSNSTTPSFQESLVGKWESDQCEALPADANGQVSYLKRTFLISKATWDLDINIFGNATCTFPLFTVNIVGPYEITGDSDKVAGAKKGSFGYTDKYFQANNEAILPALAKCGDGKWAVNTRQKINTTGCLFVQANKPECMKEFDSVKLDGDKLYFGQRTEDMCKEEGRPTKLNTYAVVRKSN